MSSVEPQTPYNEYTGNGVSTVYPYEFQLLASSDLVVTIDGVLVPTSEYLLTGVGEQDGGDVIFNTAPLSGVQVLLTRTIQLRRDIDYQYNGELPERIVDLDFNRLWQALQGIGAITGGAVRAPFPEQIPPLPKASDRANKVLAFDSGGDPVVLVPASGSAADVLIQLADKTTASLGPALVSFNPTLNYTAATLGRHEADEFWNPCDFPWLAPTNGTSDATTSLLACITAAVAAGKGVLIPRFFAVNSLTLPSNVHLRGIGRDKCGFRQISGANDAVHLADPGSATAFTTNVTIEDLTFQGTLTTDGFQEVLHLFFTQGASDLEIRGCAFRGWRGDAVYIGTGNERGQNPTQIRRNRNVRILDCHFDGQGNGGATLVAGLPLGNRNAISVIDCDGCWIERSTFTRCSKSDMPGPIDIEPDSGGTPNGTACVVRNINVLFNKFYDNFGAASGVAVNFPQSLSLYTTPVFNINIIGNDIDNGPQYSSLAHGVGIFIFGSLNVSRSIERLGIFIGFNSVKNVYSPFFCKAVRGVTWTGNKFGASKYSGEMGDVTGSTLLFDVEFDNNALTKVSSDNASGANALVLYQGMDGISITRNFFDSCGKANNAYNCNISLQGGTKTALTIEDNTFYSPVANVNAWDVRLDSGALTAGSTRHSRNRLINVDGGTVGVRNDFFTPGDWTALPLQGTWVAFAGANNQAPQYMKDSTGRVWLRGTVAGGVTTPGTSVASLPAGFRPGKVLQFPVASNGAYGELQVEASIGDIQVNALASSTRVSLNGISFKAEA